MKVKTCYFKNGEQVAFSQKQKKKRKTKFTHMLQMLCLFAKRRALWMSHKNKNNNKTKIVIWGKILKMANDKKRRENTNDIYSTDIKCMNWKNPNGKHFCVCVCVRLSPKTSSQISELMEI